jgi:hypothetical protein
MPRTLVLPPPDMDVAQVARRARYVGSAEHKDAPSFVGQPRPRADATICDRTFADRQAEITAWLRAAIREGRTGEWEGAFPRYAWHRQGDRVFEARLVNAGNGEYKGYELSASEWPQGV